MRWWVLFSLMIVGCSSGKPDGESPDDGAAESEPEGPTWHADVRPLVESRCASCHTAGGIGSFALENYEDVVLIKAAVADAVAERRMPPWKAIDGCAEYRDDISLSEEEIAMVVEWVDNGVPEGSIDDAQTGTPPEAGSLERVDLTVGLPVAYDVNTDVGDDYRCFPVEWPLEEDVFVTGYVVNPERVDLVHHLIAYIVPGSYRDALAELEAADGSAGYSCFGGPGPISVTDSDWLGAWAPGAVQGPLPNGIGIQMKAGDMLVLQMHYNSASGATGTDQTSIDFSYETEVDRPGWIQPFTDPDWVFGGGMDIPAGATDVTHDFEFMMAQSFTVHSANLHMHTLGTGGRMEIGKADGATDCLIEIDDWDFDWQRSYVFEEPKRLEAGEAWRLSCNWDNPTDKDVDWGDGTGDEMCLGTALMSLD
jgi:hypothetical protein